MGSINTIPCCSAVLTENGMPAGRFRPQADRMLVDFQKGVERAHRGRSSITHVEHLRRSNGSSAGDNGSNGSGSTAESMPPRNIVIAGWCGSMIDLVDGMQRFAPHGSNITVICECPPEVCQG